MNLSYTEKEWKRVHNIDDKVIYDGEVVTICNVAFLLNGESTSVAEGGTLKYYIEDGGENRYWVHADNLDPLPESEHPTKKVDDFFEQDDRSPHILDLGYKLLAWSDGLEARPDNEKLPEIVALLMAIQYDKEGSYGSSWKGKGEYRGIMANIDRKYDRLDKMTQDEIEGFVRTLSDQEELLKSNYELYSEEVGESKIDAIADLTNYGLLYMTYVRENFPLVFKVWVDKNVPKYLADKIPFI